MRPLLLAMLLSGCGRVDFTGVWVGLLPLDSTCEKNTEAVFRWAIVHQEDVLTISPEGGTCGNFTADVEGSRAAIRAKACQSGDLTTGGRLELLADGRLEVALPVVTQTCRTMIAGVLDRE